MSTAVRHTQLLLLQSMHGKYVGKADAKVYRLRTHMGLPSKDAHGNK
jgi:hypothetical protein